ncbi:hypothetical protein ACIOBL_26785 [Paenibacillus taichungensis]|uniref:hypothetical protein n=1 Tax=Paenibacillus taichungensis TaxID=484184 RepID=UPI003816DB78
MGNLERFIFGSMLSINIVLFIIGFLMYRKWRNPTYMKFFGAFALMLLANVGMILMPQKLMAAYMFFLSLYAAGIVLTQIGIFRLYYNKRTDKLYVHMGGTAITLVSAAMSLFLPIQMSSFLLFLSVVGVTLYTLVKIFPEVGVNPKYFIVTILFAMQMLLHLTGAFTGYEMLAEISLVFSVFASFIVFTMVFEKIIGVMQAATYTSTRDEVTGLFTQKHFIHQANQALARGKTVGVLYIEIQNSPHISEEESFKRAGRAVGRALEGSGFAGRYQGEAIVALITSSNIPLAELSNSIRMKIDVEASSTVLIGYIDIKPEFTLEDHILEAKEGAVRTKQNGLNRIFDLDQSKILAD